MVDSPERNAADDPAAPRSDDEILGDFLSARDLANYGLEGPQEFPEEAPVVPPSIDVAWSKVIAFLDACRTSTPRVGYVLGAKIPNDSAKPGSGFTAVDCSGFVRAAIRRSTDPKATEFPDGSVVQHDWVKAKQFAKSSVADGSLQDDKIRIAFLSPNDSPQKIGHVVLVRNGSTVESHSGVGPNSRQFTGTGWQALATVYILKG